MKYVLLFICLCASATVFAQSDKFESAMQNNLKQLGTAETTDDLTQVAAAFERIGDAEKTQWLPYYYAALATIRKGFTDNKADRDAVATTSESQIEKAAAIAPDNAEIYLLKSMAATLHMLVDPMSRWQSFGQKITQYRQKAAKLEPNNPRVYFLEAQNLMGTPEQFGGGKAAAKPLFEKSVALFETYKPINNLYPSWGKQDAMAMLEKIKN